ncbi:phosphate transporter [Sodiomyces alkalinus F11]|uniref:Phosphate transporter n=1 Tax=Sodiomyces alkalinus (strain CBS 110278 / VKM F-3762 / F11) TaxID=1314773 RepID=A0A3N2PIS0_SODAK|nr:phosphate transporter [Sodiomyces alkalinus F11]ROT34445.1 phosphate transporter [Sodiomyces alkalinus F11]
MALHQYDYILAFGFIFAFLDAWNIGANDVANCWATSVSSRSVSYIQAMTIGAILEFAGSVGVGARVADTIRTKVVDIDMYEDNPAMLMLGMVCAITASSIYLTICTRLGLPVSTTHTIMGGVIGMGVATLGADGVIWADLDKGINGGVIQVFLAWIIAPGLAGAFGAVIFTITKYLVMVRNNPVARGLITVPIYFGITASLCTMLLIWKGGSINPDFNDAQQAGLIVGVGAAVALVAGLFLVPWMYRVVIKDDWSLRWWHIALGPLLLRRPEPGPQPEGARGGIKDFYEGHLTKEELDALRAGGAHASDEEANADGEKKKIDTQVFSADADSQNAAAAADAVRREAMYTVEEKPKTGIVGPKPDGSFFSGPVLFWRLKWLFLSGVDRDIIKMQKRRNALSGDLDEVHSHAAHYDNRAEYLYSFLQVLTASVASFTHGANDVANAIGPFATIYEIWRTGTIAGSKSPVPIWILVYGGAGITIGLWTYGYNVMRNLGNRLTLHSPSRGFSMELGSTVTIILATKLQLPVSTTQCITGAIVGVGLCSGTWRSINWRMVAWIYAGWIFTLPVAGTFAGCLVAIIINAPRWGLAM